MFKYIDTLVTFREFPDEISLCINITGCPIHCPYCHSKHLWESTGEILFSSKLKELIEGNPGITCVGFMGGAQNVYHLLNLAIFVKSNFPNLKVGWYTGQSEIPEIINENLSEFDYIKIGPYDRERGGLDNPNTNQIMYKVIHSENGDNKLENITNKFWKCTT